MMHRSAARAFAFSALFILVLLAAPSANAQEDEDIGFFGYGVRMGASINPDQFTVGGYVKLGKLTQMFHLRPSVDLGFGGDVFTLIGNADAQIDFVDVRGLYKPFVGGGLGIMYYDVQGDQPSFADDTDTEIGLNIYGGVERAFSSYRRGYAEVRVGIDDLPDFKVTLGFGFF
jgi:hypothetical protein